MTDRLLVITRNLPPLTGGMERLNASLLNGIHRDFDITVIAPPGASAQLPSELTINECTSNRAAPFLAEAALKVLLKRIRQTPPSLVLATSGLTAPLAWLGARLSRCRFAVCLHGLDLVVDHAVYQRLFVSRLRHADLVVANSRNTARLAVTRGVPANRIEIVNPGIAWPTTLPGTGDFRQRHALGNEPMLLCVGRLTVRKGVAEFIEHCLPALLEIHPGLKLVVIGQDASQALRREHSVKARIEAAIQRTGVSHAVRLLGQVDDTELGAALINADVHVLPVIPVLDDVEGFGMVAAEAAAHGLLTAAFAEGGVLDAVIPDLTGNLVEGGDYAALTELILQQVRISREPAVRNQCRLSAQEFSEQRYVTGMRDALQACIRGPGTR